MIEEMGGDFYQWLRGFYFVAKTGSVTQAALEERREWTNLPPMNWS